MMSKLGRLLVKTTVLSGFMLPVSAHAYIDPGTGSLILQGLIAAIAGVAVTVGVYWNRLKALFRRRGKLKNGLGYDGRNVTKDGHAKQSSNDD
jgi:hypothetical protein